MDRYEAEIVSRDIFELCEQAGLKVDSIDASAGIFTVCFFPPALRTPDSATRAMLNMAQRRRDGVKYDIGVGTSTGKTTERLVFRVAQP